MSLQGKTAVVTGGGTGIGAAIAVAFAQHGCRVIIAGRREEKLQETARRFDGEPPIVTQAADVADRQQVHRLFESAERELGPIDILVNSAGINVERRSMAELDPADWDRILAVNATGAYNCIREVLPSMRRRRDGLIVNIASIAGIRGSTLGGVAYAASKFAMTGMGLTIALECHNEGVRVTNVYPGEVDTPILENRPVPISAEHRERILQPEDVAEAVLMLTRLPARAHVPELVIKPTAQEFA